MPREYLYCDVLKWMRKSSVPIGWSCPVCKRGQHELVITLDSQMHTIPWTHLHHDRGTEEWGSRLPELERFPVTLLCALCNKAEGIARRQLHLPDWWSFSPKEIRAFVTIQGRRVKIDYDKARQIWEGNK